VYFLSVIYISQPICLIPEIYLQNFKTCYIIEILFITICIEVPLLTEVILDSQNRYHFSSIGAKWIIPIFIIGEMKPRGKYNNTYSDNFIVFSKQENHVVFHTLIVDANILLNNFKFSLHSRALICGQMYYLFKCCTQIRANIYLCKNLFDEKWKLH